MTLEVVGEELSEEFMDTRGQRVVWPIHWAIRALSRVRFIGRVRLYGFIQLSTAVGYMDRRVSGRMRASALSRLECNAPTAQPLCSEPPADRADEIERSCAVWDCELWRRRV